MKVKIIQKQDGNALIEWVEDGQYHRSIVPTEAIKDGEVEHPDWGLEYGEDWAAMVGQLDADLLANELRRRGIYTVEDLRQHHKAALGAIMSAVGQVFAGLASGAQSERR